MKYTATVFAVRDIQASRKFYEELFGVEVYQDYGINVSFRCGFALQQDFDRLISLDKEKVLKKSNNVEIAFEERDFDGFLKKLKTYPDLEYLGGVIEHRWGQRVIRFYDPDGHLIEVGEEMKMVIERFLASGMNLEQVSKRMDVSVSDLKTLLEN